MSIAFTAPLGLPSDGPLTTSWDADRPIPYLYRGATTSCEDVLGRYDSRRLAQGKVIERCREIRDHYEGDIVIPLPEVDQAEAVAVANFFTQGIDQHALRIASTMPNVDFPAVGNTDLARKRAGKRRKATLAWWEDNALDLKMYRRARWLIAYASAPVLLKPDRVTRSPRWHLRDPFSSYPAPTLDYDDNHPSDCIFDFTRTYAWIRDNYPEGAAMLRRKADIDPDTLFTLLEYVDDNETLLMAIGDRGAEGAYPSQIANNRNISGANTYADTRQWSGTEAVIELERVPNRAGISPVVIPGRITLDNPIGQFDSMIGLFQQQAKLMALEVNAVMRGVYNDTWVVARDDRPAEIVTMADGLKGVVGEIRGGEIVYKQDSPSNYVAFQLSDRLERAQRQNALIPSDFGGESASNVRTGKRGESILSSTVDPAIAESHKILARSVKKETQIAIAIAKGYFGNTPRSFYVSWKGARGSVEYTPNKDFENDHCNVWYSHPGADVNALIIGIGQRTAIGTLSAQSAAEMDPMIDDAELEHDRILSESLEKALLTSLQEMAASGQLPPEDVAFIRKKVASDEMSLEDAVLAAQEAAQARQAQQVAPEDPLAQPGLSMPGAGSEAQPAIAAPTASVSNLANAFSQLRRPQMSIPAEQGVPAQ